MKETKSAARSSRADIMRGGTLFKVAFSFPAVLIYLVAMIIPIFLSIYYSLHKWGGIGAMQWAGIKNYTKMFSSSDYQMVTGNTFMLVLLSLLITVPLSLALAYLIFRTARGFKFFRASIFVPVIISPFIIGIIFAILLNAYYGPINQFLKMIGLGALARPWLSDTGTVLYAVIAAQIWQNLGYFTIIFLAGMQSVPEEILESARIDGANSFSVFRRIMIPLIADVWQIVIVLVVTGALKSFGFSQAMTAGGPGSRSAFFTVYLYRKAFLESDFGTSSAASFMILLYALVFTLLFNWVCRRIKNITE